VEYAYTDRCTFIGFKYRPRKYPREMSIPYVPLEKDIDQLIACAFRTKNCLELWIEDTFFFLYSS
jgi:hypothetical protein